MSFANSDDDQFHQPHPVQPFDGFSAGDEPYPDEFDEFVSRPYYAGTSRRLYSGREIASVVALLLLVLFAAWGISASVEGRTLHDDPAASSLVSPTSGSDYAGPLQTGFALTRS